MHVYANIIKKKKNIFIIVIILDNLFILKKFLILNFVIVILGYDE